jgi:hypothetical protein
MDRAGSPRPVPTGTLPVIDVGILLAVVGLLATVAWLGHDTWHRLPPEALATIDMSPSCLPYYAVRSLLRMVTRYCSRLGRSHSAFRYRTAAGNTRYCRRST